MVLWKYLQNKDCLPNPRNSLSTVVPAKAISSANEAEIEVLSSSKKRRRPYKRYVCI